MYKNDTYDPEIEINLYPGIYAFLKESAVGKTRLYSALKEMMHYGEPVYAFTYNDYLDGRRFDNEIEPQKYKVIMLDRFDMYTEFDAPSLERCLADPDDEAIILVDYKGRYPVSFSERTCDIKMSPGKIVVSDDLYF